MSGAKGLGLAKGLAAAAGRAPCVDGGAAGTADVEGVGVGGRSGGFGAPPAGLLLLVGEVGSERGLLPIFKVA